MNPFRDIWEAKAFAVGNLLIKSGFMSREEWVEIFSEEIKAAQQRGDEDRGDTYYSHWMHALERIAVERGLSTGPELRERQRLWQLARENTPHGVAVSLEHAFHSPDAGHGHGDGHSHVHGHAEEHLDGGVEPFGVSRGRGTTDPVDDARRIEAVDDEAGGGG